MAELQQLGCVVGPAIILFRLFFLFGLESGRGDFVRLKAQHLDLLSISTFVHHQRGLLLFNRRPPTHHFGEGIALAFQLAECVQDGQLLGRVQQRLVLVRSMDIHQPFAYRGQHVQGRRRAIDELPVRARARKRSLQHELALFARLQPILLQK